MSFYRLVICVLCGLAVFPSCEKSSDTSQRRMTSNIPIATDEKNNSSNKEDDNERYTSEETRGPKPPDSIISIIANPDRYDGKHVTVEGCVRIEFEGDSIYLSEADATYHITANGFWLQYDHAAIGKDRKELARAFHGKYVLLEGVFKKGDCGHMAMWPGEIVNVSRIQTSLKFPLERKKPAASPPEEK